MSVKYVWGLQQLKKNVRDAEQEKLAFLESKFLDLLHRQKLYNHVQSLEREKDEIIQQLEILALQSSSRSFTELCVVPQVNSPKSGDKSSTLIEPFPYYSKHSEMRAQPYTIPKIKSELLTDAVPITYCYQLSHQQYPLITLDIDNTDEQSSDILLNTKVHFEGYSDVAAHNIEVQAGSKQKVTLLPSIRREHMKEISEQCPVTLHIEIQYIFPISFTTHETYRVRFLSHNAVVLWQIQQDGSLLDCTPYLASWVTPHHKEIEKLLRKSAEYHTETRITGYNNSLATRAERARIVNEQVQAMFEVLQHEGKLAYISSPEIIDSQSDRVIQRVRLPSEVLEIGGSANCIDGSVLFASLLELAHLQPLIFLQTGHALVGWRVFKDEPIYEFLETTLICKGNFKQAVRVAQQQYEQAQASGSLGRDVGDPRGFACIIDITECRRKNIMPME